MERLDRIEKLMEDLLISQKETDGKFKETDAKFKETDGKFKETEKLVKALTTNIGGVSNSNGAFAEEFFFNALKKNKTIGGIKFDAINKNVSFSKKGINGEFDIVLINGDAIGLIETKYKATESNLDDLISKKPSSFRALFPEFKEYKFYLGLAGMSFDSKKVEDKAHKAGVAILKHKGEIMILDDHNLKAY